MMGDKMRSSSVIKGFLVYSSGNLSKVHSEKQLTTTKKCLHSYFVLWNSLHVQQGRIVSFPMNTSLDLPFLALTVRWWDGLQRRILSGVPHIHAMVDKRMGTVVQITRNVWAILTASRKKPGVWGNIPGKQYPNRKNWNNYLSAPEDLSQVVILTFVRIFIDTIVHVSHLRIYAPHLLLHSHFPHPNSLGVDKKWWLKICLFDTGVVYITELVLRNSPLEFGWKEILHQNSKHAAQGTIFFRPKFWYLKSSLILSRSLVVQMLTIEKISFR